MQAQLKILERGGVYRHWTIKPFIFRNYRTKNPSSLKKWKNEIPAGFSCIPVVGE